MYLSEILCLIQLAKKAFSVSPVIKALMMPAKNSLDPACVISAPSTLPAINVGQKTGTCKKRGRHNQLNQAGYGPPDTRQGSSYRAYGLDAR